MHSKTNRFHKLLLILIASVGFILRISYLENVPPGLTMDEVSIGYNAFTIRTAGTDQEGNVLPRAHFKSLGDYKLPLHIYLVAASQFLFGNTAFAIRLPGVLLSTATIVVAYFLAKHLFDDYVAIITSFLLAISPWHVFHSRLGLETTPAIFFFTVGLFFFVMTKKNPRRFIYALLFFILAFYTHHDYWVFLPPFLLSLCIIKRHELMQISVRTGAILICIIVLASIPFLTEPNIANSTRRNQSILSYQNIASLGTEGIQNCPFKSFSLLCSSSHIAYSLFSHVSVQYMNSFSLLIWYAPTGFDTVDVLPMRGLFYAFESILFIIGLLYLFRQKNTTSFILLSWLLFFPLPLIMTGNISAARMIQLLPLPFIIEALGFREIRKIHPAFIYVFIIIIIFSFGRFIADMFFIYPYKFSNQTDYGYIAVKNYIQSHPANEFYIDTSLFSKLHAYFYYSIPPSIISSDKITPSGTVPLKYGNISLVERGYVPSNKSQSLFISRLKDVPSDYTVINEIKLLDGGTYATISKPKIQ